MQKKSIAYLLVNFGGPRSLSEIEPFLKALLTDEDVIRTKLPKFVNRLFFERLAKKRAVTVKSDYEKIGGFSPIFADTEALASLLKDKLDAPVYTFHRYLPSTHKTFFEKILSLNVDEIHVFPLFPQFCFATTGSIAKLFYKNFPKEVLNKLHWVKSFATHPHYIAFFQELIKDFLKFHRLSEEKTIFLFSAHGIPKEFVESGDFYQKECEASFEKILEGFPNAVSKLCYQSQFGREEWIRPYTNEVCERIEAIAGGRENVLFIPLSFTSDHIETLFEIEEQYMPIIREQGLNAYRLPSFNRDPRWVEVIASILGHFDPHFTSMLVRFE